MNDTIHAKSGDLGQAEKINQVLFAIADAVNTTPDLYDLYRSIHQSLGLILDVTNFFIAIVDQQERTLYFPYHADTVDEDFGPINNFGTSTSLTGLVVLQRKGILLREKELKAREANDGIWGPSPLVWMGVPLLIRDEVIGVVAVQNYINGDMFDENDLQILTAVSHQIAVAIDRKQSLEKLRKSEETYRNIFLNAQVGLFRLQVKNGIVYECNDALAEMLGYKNRNECQGKISLYEIQAPTTLNRFDDACRKSKEIKKFEIQVHKANGGNSWLRMSARYSKDGMWVEGVAEDITDFKTAYDEKLKLQEKLARSKKMEALGLLASGVAHDLNNILSGVISYPELMLLRLEENHDLVPSITAIRESGKRAALIVDDLLAIARGAARSKEPHSLHDIVSDYLQSPEILLLTSNQDVNIDTELTAQENIISCSPTHIKKCLMNLVTNGVEAMDGEGLIEISTENIARSAAWDTGSGISAQGFVALRIKDNGHGIPDKDLDRIFEPFYTKKVMGKSGTGLGLAVVWNTMEDHAGEVMVESDEQGTCFTLLFPLTSSKVAQQNEASDLIQYRGNKESVLIVDDEPLLRDIGVQTAMALGYTAFAVSSGESAIDFLHRNSVDLILLDMMMDPGMNGRETYEEALKIRPGQKTILVSGYSASEEVNIALQKGVGAFVKKPYTLEQMGKAIHDVLSS